MHTLTTDLFDRLAALEDDSVLSIQLPTHRGGPETEKSRIHLKNGIDKARTMLQERGISAEQINRRLMPLEDLTNDTSYWQHQSEGLSVFQYRDRHVEVSSPKHLEPFVQVGRRPHVSPLIEQLGYLQSFAVLTLSGNRVSMYRLQGDMMKKLDVPGLPESYEDLGQYIDSEKHLQFHNAGPNGGPAARSDAMYHGHGVTNDSEKKLRFQEFAQMIDHAVTKYLRNTTRDPLIVLAAEPLHSIYRETNTYGDLIETDATGNTDHFSEKEIAAAARSHMDAAMNDRKSVALDDMKERLGSDGVLYEITDVLEAAADGRLERLIGANDLQVWGTASLDSAPREIRVHNQRRAGDEDLHNLAMITAHQTGAEVIAMPQSCMPEGRPLLGLRRF